MKIRPATSDDHAVIQALHDQMGTDYRFPDLSDPLFLLKFVATDDSGHIVGACAIRIEAETYLWLDQSRSTMVKSMAVREMNLVLRIEAWRKGLANLVARIPSAIETKFAPVLTRLGWTRQRDGWIDWNIDLP